MNQKKTLQVAKKVASGDVKLLRAASNHLYRKNDLVIRISPLEAGQEYLKEQVNLGLYLDKAGVPTSKPMSREVDLIDDFYVTYWTFLDGRSGIHATAEELGQLLRLFHDQTSDYQGNLPDWSYQEGAGLRESEKLENNPYLTEKDIDLIKKRSKEFIDQVKSLDLDLGTGVIHGDFSPANIITTPKPHIIDFDRICFGPREYDLAHPIHSEVFFGHGSWEGFYRAYGVTSKDKEKFIKITYLKSIFTMLWLCSQEDSQWKKEETALRMKFWRDPNSNWPKWNPPPR